MINNTIPIQNSPKFIEYPERLQQKHDISLSTICSKSVGTEHESVIKTRMEC